MTKHEETAKRLLHELNCVPLDSNEVAILAAALAQAEARGMRMGLERAREIVRDKDCKNQCALGSAVPASSVCERWEMVRALDAEIAKAGGKSPA